MLFDIISLGISEDVNYRVAPQKHLRNVPLLVHGMSFFALAAFRNLGPQLLHILKDLKQLAKELKIPYSCGGRRP
jgi:hypothetical protein